MSLRSSAVVFGLIVLASVVMLFGEHPLSSPGPISESHADLDLGCRACHTPFRGPQGGCESCHGSLSATNVHANTDVSCSDCHQEHQDSGRSIVERAMDDCSSCHAHASIESVEGHGIGSQMLRPVSAEDPLRVASTAFRSFSHALHFDELGVEVAQQTCVSCHLTGESPRAEQAVAGEHLLRWSGCQDCHDDWEEAGFPSVAPEISLVPIVLSRMPRIEFTHSEGHLEADCSDCHLRIHEASEIGEAQDSALAATLRAHPEHAAVSSCFECHGTAEVRLAAATLETHAAGPESISSCVHCHALHGSGDEADFPEDPSDDARPESRDVWARVAEIAITPLMLGFLILTTAGLAAVIRMLPTPAKRADLTEADSASQRVAEVPVLAPSGETSVSGVYIVGELAGVPLVNRAMKSGFDAIDFIANRLKEERPKDDDSDQADSDQEIVDVLIVGSGPSGLGAATRAKFLGLSYVVCEKSTPAATIRNYPRAKIIQAAPIDIPDYGSFYQEDDESKEALVERWEDIIEKTGVVIYSNQEVVGIKAESTGELVTETDGGLQYRSRTVVLALGMRGTPRRLGVEGEVPERVAYLLVDAAECRDRDILVVGGGNAAIEAALDLAEPGLGNRVTVSYKRAVLTSITAENAKRVDEAVAHKLFDLVTASNLIEIHEDNIVLDTAAGRRVIANQMVFAMIGAELPMGFLRGVGIKLARKGGI